MSETIEEDEGAPTNNVGDGRVAGTGVGPQGEPGYKSSKVLKRRGFKEFFKK